MYKNACNAKSKKRRKTKFNMEERHYENTKCPKCGKRRELWWSEIAQNCLCIECIGVRGNNKPQAAI